MFNIIENHVKPTEDYIVMGQICIDKNFRKQGIDESWLTDALDALGWEVMLNKRGTTFRQLEDSQKSDLDKNKASALMLAHPAMIKRPVLVHEGNFTCGFSDASYTEIFGA